MSIYVQLLQAALAEAQQPSDETTTSDAVAELLRRRGDLYTRGSSHAGSFWAPDAVANELAYDIALIRLAKMLGVECGVDDFDRPGKGRAHVELALMSRGIRLDEPDTTEATC
jgi:hypothetical protein